MGQLYVIFITTIIYVNILIHCILRYIICRVLYIHLLYISKYTILLHSIFEILITRYRYNFSELMAACMRATYGVSETKFRKSRKSMSLDTIAKNLSGETNPGSRILLAKMQSRKRQLRINEFIQYLFRVIRISRMVTPVLSACLRKKSSQDNTKTQAGTGIRLPAPSRPCCHRTKFL